MGQLNTNDDHDLIENLDFIMSLDLLENESEWTIYDTLDETSTLTENDDNGGDS